MRVLLCTQSAVRAVEVLCAWHPPSQTELATKGRNDCRLHRNQAHQQQADDLPVLSEDLHPQARASAARAAVLPCCPASAHCCTRAAGAHAGNAPCQAPAVRSLARSEVCISSNAHTPVHSPTSRLTEPPVVTKNRPSSRPLKGRMSASTCSTQSMSKPARNSGCVHGATPRCTCSGARLLPDTGGTWQA